MGVRGVKRHTNCLGSANTSGKPQEFRRATKEASAQGGQAGAGWLRLRLRLRPGAASAERDRDGAAALCTRAVLKALLMTVTKLENS